MKKFLIGIFALSSVSTFAANCNVFISQWGVNGEHLSNRYVTNKLSIMLTSKGYNLTKKEDNAYFNVNLHYYGMISDRGRSKTVGTILTLSEADNGYKIAESKSESFIGTSKGISKKTFKQNITKIERDIPLCE